MRACVAPMRCCAWWLVRKAPGLANPKSDDGTFGPNDPAPTSAEAEAAIVAIWKGGQVEWVGGESVSEEEVFVGLGPLEPHAA